MPPFLIFTTASSLAELYPGALSWGTSAGCGSDIGDPSKPKRVCGSSMPHATEQHFQISLTLTQQPPFCKNLGMALCPP